MYCLFNSPGVINGPGHANRQAISTKPLLADTDIPRWTTKYAPFNIPAGVLRELLSVMSLSQHCPVDVSRRESRMGVQYHSKQYGGKRYEHIREVRRLKVTMSKKHAVWLRSWLWRSLWSSFHNLYLKDHHNVTIAFWSNFHISGYNTGKQYTKKYGSIILC